MTSVQTDHLDIDKRKTLHGHWRNGVLWRQRGRRSCGEKEVKRGRCNRRLCDGKNFAKSWSKGNSKGQTGFRKVNGSDARVLFGVYWESLLEWIVAGWRRRRWHEGRWQKWWEDDGVFQLWRRSGSNWCSVRRQSARFSVRRKKKDTVTWRACSRDTRQQGCIFRKVDWSLLAKCTIQLDVIFRQRTRRSDCKAGGCEVLLKELCSASVFNTYEEENEEVKWTQWSAGGEGRINFRKREIVVNTSAAEFLDFRSTLFPSRKRRELWVWTFKRTLSGILWYPPQGARERRRREETIWSTRTCQGSFPRCRTMFQGVTRQAQSSRSQWKVLPIDEELGKGFADSGEGNRLRGEDWGWRWNWERGKEFGKGGKRERDGVQH